MGPWTMTAHPLNETSWLSPIEPVENVQLPAFYRTQFTLPANYTKCLDTYLDTTGWSKVCLFCSFIFWSLKTTIFSRIYCNIYISFFFFFTKLNCNHKSLLRILLVGWMANIHYVFCSLWFEKHYYIV